VSTRSATLTPDLAAAERALRELARRRMVTFGVYVYPWWRPAAVHRLVCSELEKVYEYIRSGGEQGTGSLIVEMPPQHGKTTNVSQLFPAWLLGKRPDSRVILTAYGAELSQENSRMVRNIVTGERFAALFGVQSVMDEAVRISEDSSARNAWNLAEPFRGGLVATGVGGGTTGKAADLIVVDDPFKNREEAENPVERKKVLRWMTSSILSRARKGTAIIIIHTRWHREDLIGEMLKSTQTDPRSRPWKILSLPAYPLEANEYALNLDEQMRAMLQGLYKPFQDPLGREPGSKTPLWEQEFPREMLEQARSTLEATGQMTDWYSLYMQQPRPAEGAFFGSNDFEIVERAPEKLTWYRYVDLALSEKKTADYNASVAVAMDAEGVVYLRDMIRGQGWTDYKERLKAAMVDPRERGVHWGLENVAFQALAFQELMREPSLANTHIVEIRPEGDKVTRARPMQGRAKAGRLRLVRGPWNQAFILEALDFPNGIHDDQVDTASGGLQMLAQNEFNQVEVVEDPFASW
jgi:predicted phage terminase large subunit-like protein